jgi:pimeloyl-ACP methyl ester carboxylesterase
MDGLNRQVNDELGADGMRHCSTPEFWRALAQLDVPVMLVHGEQDPRPMWAVEKLARTLPSAELVALPGVGHFPDLEVPERYRELVRGFLSA